MLWTGLKVLLLVVVLAVAYGLGVQTSPDVKKLLGATSDGAAAESAPDRDVIYALAKLRPASGTVPVVAPPGDRVEELFVEQLQEVKAGDKLARLASHTDREQEVKLADQQLQEGQDQLKATNAAEAARLTEVKSQVESAQARFEAEEKAQKLKLGLLKRQLDVATKRQERVANLDRSKVRVPTQEVETLNLAVTQAQAELDVAQDALEALQQRQKRELVSAAAQKVSIRAEYDLARRRVPIPSLTQSLALARRRLEHTLIKAPVGGIVLRLNVNRGDPTTTAPLLELASVENMVAIAEVYASDADLLTEWVRKAPVKAVLKSPALSAEGESAAPLEGVVKGPLAIGQSVTRNTVLGFSPRADTDRRIIEVRVDIKEGVARARRFIGLEVDAEFIRPAGDRARRADKVSR